VVALDLPTKTMLDQPARTLRALEPVSANPAERQRRISAPIEEKQGLFATLDRLAHRLQQDRREEAPALRWVAPHIDKMQIG